MRPVGSASRSALLRRVEARRTGIAIAAIALLSLAANREVLTFWFTGVDVYPLIESSRVRSVADLLALLTEPGEAFGPVLRPTGRLLFALDHWIWGTDPFGYHLTDLLLHTLTAVLVLLLARELGFERSLVVGVLASLLFAIHPLHAAALPLIPARFDRMLGTFTLLTLLLTLRYVDRPSRRALVACASCGALALLTKPTGVVVVPMALLGAVVRCVERHRPLRSLMTLALVYGTLLVGYLAYRVAVLGELSGYPADRRAPLSSLALTTLRFFSVFLHPLAFLGESVPARLVAVLSAGVATAGIAVFVLLGLLRLVLGTRRPGSGGLVERSDRDRWALFLVFAWLAAYLPLYGLTYVLTEIFKPLYLYATLPFWCLGLAALVVHGVLSAISLQSRAVRSLRALVASWLLGLALTGLAVGTLLGSPWLRGYDEWRTASDASKAYLEALERAIRPLPNGATVFLLNLPHGVECSRPPCMGKSYMFEDYSVHSWVKLVQPQRDLEFVAVSTVWLDREEGPIESELLDARAGAGLVLRNSGGRVEPPWRTQSERYWNARIEEGSRPQRVTLQPKQGAIPPRAYLFDFFEPRRILSVGPEGWVRPVDSSG